MLHSDEPIEDESIFRKIANYRNVKPDCVIENRTVPILYVLPILLEREAHFSQSVQRELHMEALEADLQEWTEMVERIKNRRQTAKIALVGQYAQLHDAYLSVAEALRHAGYNLGARVEIDRMDSETLTEQNTARILSEADGIPVSGGFGGSVFAGMLLATQYARENGVPYLGMQIACIEYASNVLGYANANPSEFDEDDAHCVIDFLPGQSDGIDKGGALRLGSYPCRIQSGTLLPRFYGSDTVHERRCYEFNNHFRDAMEKAGMFFSGLSPDEHLVESMEVTGHPFFIGVQYHPEFKSRPNRAHPLFTGFVEAALHGRKQ